MPCRTGFEEFENSAQFQEQENISNLLNYAKSNTKLSPALVSKIKAFAKDGSGYFDELELCSYMLHIDKKHRERLLSADCDDADKLRIWWRNHRKKDIAQREQDINKLLGMIILVGAYKKLSKQEAHILGLRDWYKYHNKTDEYTSKINSQIELLQKELLMIKGVNNDN